MKGWIKLHRKIKDHWLWGDPTRFQRWIIMLLEVNYTEGKMTLGNRLITVKRGGSANSLRTWSDLFGCGTKATTNFFELLESDGMITRKTLGKGKHSTTLINVTNYEEYQTGEETLTDTLTTTLGQREGHTIKEGKEGKENKKREGALDFLKEKCPSRFQQFEMQNKTQIKDYHKFCLDYNSKVDEEALRFEEGILFARLNRFARNWISLNEKFKQKEDNHSSSNIPIL